MSSIIAELKQVDRDGASDSRVGASARHVDRISKIIERSILMFVVLVTLLGHYANHSYLMREALIS